MNIIRSICLFICSIHLLFGLIFGLPAILMVSSSIGIVSLIASYFCEHYWLKEDRPSENA